MKVNKTNKRWTEEEIRLLNLWLQANPTKQVSYKHIESPFSKDLPGRNAQSIYSKIWSLRNNGKEGRLTLIGKIPGKRIWTRDEINSIRVWMANNPGKKITQDRMDKSLSDSIPTRSLAAIATYARRFFRGEQIPIVEKQPMFQSADVLKRCFNIVDVLNNAVEAYVSSLTDTHKSLRDELAELHKEKAELIDELERQKKLNRIMSHLD
jgi:hypothetical protein